MNTEVVAEPYNYLKMFATTAYGQEKNDDIMSLPKVGIASVLTSS